MNTPGRSVLFFLRETEDLEKGDVGKETSRSGGRGNYSWDVM